MRYREKPGNTTGARCVRVMLADVFVFDVEIRWGSLSFDCAVHSFSASKIEERQRKGGSSFRENNKLVVPEH